MQTLTYSYNIGTIFFI